MATDARISTGLPGHPKTKKLIRRLGPAAGWHLVCLFLWVADNRSDGDLAGMTDEDIELAIDWAGEDGAFVKELVSVGFVEGEEGARAVHDWEEHNPWAAGSEKRAEKSRFAALCRRYGREEAARMMPEHSTGKPVADQTPAQDRPPAEDSLPVALPDSARSMPVAGSGTAPSPNPIPNPIPNPNTPPPPPGGDVGDPERKTRGPKDVPEGFDEFWSLYPRKDAKADAVKAWKTRKLHEDPSQRPALLAGLRTWLTHEQWTRDGGKFVPYPASWLRGERWSDQAVVGVAAGPASTDSGWWQAAGFPNRFEAENARCFAHTAHLFRNGQRVPVGEAVAA